MNLFFWKKKQTIIEPEQTEAPGQQRLNLQAVSFKDFQRMVKFGKASDRIGKYQSKPFIELPYGIVKKDLPLYQKKELLYESVELILGCQYADLDLSFASGNEILQFLIWMKEQQAFIKDREEQHLVSEPDPDMAAAGIDQLNVHGEVITIDSLAKGDLLKHDLIEQLPYHKVFKKLLIDKDIRSFEKRYAKVIEAKNKKVR